MFLKRRKKGIVVASSTLIIMMMVIIGFFVILSIVNSFADSLDDAAMDLVCKASIVARAKSVIQFGSNCVPGTRLLSGCVPNPLSKISTYPFICKTKRYEKSGDRYEVMDAMAILMENCWATFAEGKFPYTIEDKGSGDTCFPCYVLHVKKIETSGKEEPIIYFDEFLSYLDQHESNIANATSYYDYLTFYEGIPGALLTDDIKPNTAYYIMYSDPALGTKKGAEETPNGIYVMPIEEANEIATWIGKRSGKIEMPWKLQSCNIIGDVGGK